MSLAGFLDQAVLRKALGVSPVAFLICDMRAADTPIVYANKAFETLTGYSAPEILGQNCRFLQGADRHQPARGIIREALAEGKPCKVTLRNFRKDGTAFVNELRLAPLYDEDGDLTHFVGCQSEVPFPLLVELDDSSLAHVERLTAREREMFSLMIEGHSNKSAAELLDISPRTAEKHRQRVLKKMEAKNVVELLAQTVAGDHRDD